MPKLLPALAIRAAVVATATAAATLVAVLPATTAAAAPAPFGALTIAVPVTPVVFAVAAPVPTPAVAVPTAATATALSNALTKLGSPYRWGAAGPSAFDCSGLVSWAYRQAGVTLPRTSRAMSTVGTPVAKSDLQPGDLVFFYRPVSHVAIYVGNGKVVHASTSGTPVKIASLDGMPFNSARRI